MTYQLISWFGAQQGGCAEECPCLRKKKKPSCLGAKSNLLSTNLEKNNSLYYTAFSQSWGQFQIKNKILSQIVYLFKVTYTGAEAFMLICTRRPNLASDLLH